MTSGLCLVLFGLDETSGAGWWNSWLVILALILIVLIVFCVLMYFVWTTTRHFYKDDLRDKR